MSYITRIVAVISIAIASISSGYAQKDTTEPVKIAVFLPLHLNDAFEGYSYKLDNASIPKHILPGLEFYNGVIMAIDSLAHDGSRVQVAVYDTKQPDASINSLLNGSELNTTSLIIGSFTTQAEVKKFSDHAFKRNIPLISATYPNAGGVNANPYFVLLNSTLSTHLTGIYGYLQSNHPGAAVVAFKKAGSLGDYMTSTFASFNKSSASSPVKIKWIDLPDNFNTNDVVKHLDSLAPNNIVLVASPVESFGVNVVKAISASEQYRATAIGMPTWDGLRELNQRDCRNVEIVYSTPFAYNRADDFEAMITKQYRSKFYSRPSDMVFRGFETTYHFGKLLLRYKKDLINNLSSNEFKLFNDFDVKPVRLRDANTTPDYFENKKRLYFIRKQEGNIKSIS